MLSNHNQQVWYNPNTKKMLFNVAGTHNLKDWGTDLYLAFGKLKDTNRYKEARNILNEAKRKYGNDIETKISGHSLGGAIAQYVGGKDDKVYTLDKGATIGQKTRSNENAYRTSGDIVSALNANSTRMNTLNNYNKSTGFIPLDILKAHNVENIKNDNIFVD
jgi:predicted alpha/beta-fold hydrolase